MVKKSIILSICLCFAVSLQAFETGDYIVSSKTFSKRNGEVTIYEGQIYQVVRINTSGLPVINTDPRVALGTYEQTYFETVQNYTKYQQVTEVIAFISGASLLLTFVKGFNNPFSF